MDYRKMFSTCRVIFSFTIVSVVIPVLAQQTRAQDSWLDRPLVNWNRQSGRPAQLPQPNAAPKEPSDTDRCSQQVRQLASPAERALVRRGWRLYGPIQKHELTRISTALSDFDGMCRPLGFQAFVYWEGRYAGTLSPVPMDSRTDGSLTDIRVNSATSISADFVRYKESDPLCCPSRISTVVYSLRRDDRPTLTARKVMHRTVPETSESPSSNSANQAVLLFGKRWTLTEMEDRKFNRNEPYIEFDRDQRRASGSGGCNRFFGTFEIDGSQLKLSRIGSTKRACIDPELQRAETRFLQLLETTTRFEIQGNKLRLYASDHLVLVFASK